MKPQECRHEHETVRAVLSRRWPDGVAAELRRHVDGCAACRDVVLVATVLGSDRDASLRDVRVPAAGQVWWRSALRAHIEAEQAARRPVVWLQGIGAACALALIAALVSLAWPSIYDTVSGLAALRPDASLVEALRPVMPFALALLACLVIAPIAVYFALSDE